MTVTHTLSRIVATSGPELSYQWSDGYSETQAPDWTGWMRGVTAGHSDAGEYERYDGTSPFNDADEVLAVFLASGGVVEPYVELIPVTVPAEPDLYAALGITIVDGAMTVIDQAAQFGQVLYEDGWVMAVFTGLSDNPDYMIFAQTDIPARMDQYKSEGSFELVFSDPANGDPVEPGRIDIQIVKVG